MATQTEFDIDDVRKKPWEHYLRHNLYIWPLAFLAGFIIVQGLAAMV